MEQYIYVANLEHREWERQFNARAARGEFVVYPGEERRNLVDAVRDGLSQVARRASHIVAAFSGWIRRLRGTEAVPSTQ
jgi:hypothetical protein